METINLGCSQSEKDYRDIKHSSLTLATPLPQEYIIDYSTVPVFHQKKVGCCTAASNAKKKEKMEGVAMSVRYLYTTGKLLVDRNTDESSSIRTMLKTLQTYGCVEESQVPSIIDDTTTYDQFIDKTLLTDDNSKLAEKHRDQRYVSVAIDETTLKNAIYTSTAGVSARMEVGKEWFTDTLGNVSWDKDKILPLRPPQISLSGHAIILIGWKTIGGRTAFILRNSWSAQWGDNGNGYFFFDEYKPTEAWVSYDVSDQLIAEVKQLPKSSDFHYQWTQPMYYGETTEDIKNLQIALKIDGVMPITIPTTGYYGDGTKKAVMAYQIKNNLAAPWYIKTFLGGKSVGPKTVGVLNIQFK